MWVCFLQVLNIKVQETKLEFIYILGLVDFVPSFAHDFILVDHQTADRNLSVLQSICGLQRVDGTGSQFASTKTKEVISFKISDVYCLVFFLKKWLRILHKTSTAESDSN